MGVNAAGIAVVPDVRASLVSELDLGAGYYASIGEVSRINRVDLNRLLTRIYDMHVVDQGASGICCDAGHDMNRVIVSFPQSQICHCDI